MALVATNIVGLRLLLPDRVRVDQDRDRQHDLKAEQSNIRLLIGLLSRQTVGSRQTNKLETPLLVGLGARFEKSYLKRCRKPILLLILRLRLLPQTHTFSNFAASFFRVRFQIV